MPHDAQRGDSPSRPTISTIEVFRTPENLVGLREQSGDGHPDVVVRLRPAQVAIVAGWMREVAEQILAERR